LPNRHLRHARTKSFLFANDAVTERQNAQLALRKVKSACPYMEALVTPPMIDGLRVLVLEKVEKMVMWVWLTNL